MNVTYLLFGFAIMIFFPKKINDIVRNIRSNDTGKLKANSFFLLLMILATIVVFFALFKLNQST